jgi:sugar-specific transcriptional regulator TrmB
MEELLRQLNLTQYEIKAYIALLKVGAVTAYKLGNLSGIPSGRIYDVVESLVSKGLVSVLPGTPKQVKAINPKIGLKALLVQKDREWKSQLSQLQNAINQFEQKKEPEEVSISRGENVYYQNIVEIYGKVKKELFIIAGGLTPHKKGVDLITPTKMIIKKNVDNKMIVPIDKHNIERAKKLIRLGVKLKNSYLKKNMRLHVVDGEYAMITIIGKSEKNRSIIKINQPESVQTLREMFLSLWEKSKEVESPLIRK